MKNYCFLFLTFFTLLSCGYSQQPATSLYGQYIWNQSVLLTVCSKDGIPNADASTRLSIPKQKFKLLKILEDSKNAVIQVLNYNPGDPNFDKYNFLGGRGRFTDSDINIKIGLLGEQQIYFLVNMNDVTQFAVKDFVQGWALAFGVVNYPFKFRPQEHIGDFSGSFNFGAALGITIPHRSWRRMSQTLITGYSISNVNMDSASVNQNSDKLKTTNNYTAFSFSIGWLWEFDKVQVGIFLGWDKIARINQLLYDWKYQGRSWLSIGFGYSIFSIAKPNEPTDTKQ